MKDKNDNLRLFSLIIILIILVGIFFWLWQKNASDSTNQLNVSPTVNNNNLKEPEKENSNLDQEDAENPTEEESETPETFTNQQPVDDNQSTEVQNVTKKQYSSSAEQKIIQFISDFESAFGSLNYSKTFDFFLSSIRNSESEKTIQAQKLSPPRSFDITSIEIRTDQSVLVEVTETRADNSQLKRIFELAPQDNNYKIVSYFKTDDASTYAGFN